jgi:hypothetical protein
VIAYEARRYKVFSGRILEGRAPLEVFEAAVRTEYRDARLEHQIRWAYEIERAQAWRELHRQRPLELWASRWPHRRKKPSAL